MTRSAQSPKTLSWSKRGPAPFAPARWDEILEARRGFHPFHSHAATNGGVEGTTRDGIDRGHDHPQRPGYRHTEEARQVILGGMPGAFPTVCEADDIIHALA